MSIQRYILDSKGFPRTHTHGDIVLYSDIAPIIVELERLKGLATIRENTENGLRKQLSDERAELAALRKVREAERVEVDCAREYNKLRNVKRGTGVLSDWQRRLSSAREATDTARKNYAEKGWTE